VFAALAVSHWIERQTGWSMMKFVRTSRRYRTVQIRAGNRVLHRQVYILMAKLRGNHCSWNALQIHQCHVRVASCCKFDGQSQFRVISGDKTRQLRGLFGLSPASADEFNPDGGSTQSSSVCAAFRCPWELADKPKAPGALLAT
jgi:hypothetical protein